jgi:hypothetical protein
MRETILDRAVQVGKIPTGRRDHYRTLYDRDQPGTVRLIASLAPGVPLEAAAALASITAEPPYPRELFPELARRPRAVVSAAIGRTPEEPPSFTSPAAAASPPLAAEAPLISPELSEQLFPELRERTTQRQSRVTWADR